VAVDPGERATGQLRLQQAEVDFDPVPFDAAAAKAFGRVTASLHRAERKAGARSYDAMIAAVALANDLPLFTCNPADFEHIDGLDLRSVPHPDQTPGT
jgi:tRNA(fMet)-specific endonuclease VapC